MAALGMRCQRNAPLLFVLTLTLLILACSLQGLANANAINDVNNMLRDSSNTGHSGSNNNDDVAAELIASTTAAAGSHVRASAAAAEVRVIHNNNNNNNNHNEYNNYANNAAARSGGAYNDVDDDNDVVGDGDFSVNGDNGLIDNESSVESGEMLRFVDDHNVVVHTGSGNAQQQQVTSSGDSGEMLPLNDQVRLLTKQLNALMMRRREDYEMLERNLRKSLRITSSGATATTGSVDADVRNELLQLRHEIKTLREAHPLIGNKEKLTIDWLTKSIAEIRKQLVELQQIASNANKDISRRMQSFEDLATLRSDFRQLKLELAAMRERQERIEVFVQELREETLQQEEDFKRLLHNHQRSQSKQSKQAVEKVNRNEKLDRKQESDGDSYEESKEGDSSSMDEEDGDSSKDIELSTAMLADHKRRHYRFQRQQIHELQLAQHDLKRQLTELKYHRIAERVRSIEIEQHRIADANFNLSRQIASLDKLHSSMLELLEDVEGLQNKMDKNIPEIRHEISKLEFSTAQLNSEQSLVREEGKNVARSVQAMAVSVSALQEERDGVRATQSNVQQLQQQVNRMQTSISEMQHSLMAHPHQHQRRTQKLGHTGQTSSMHHHHGHSSSSNNNNNNNNHNANTNHNASSRLTNLQSAENLVTKLENVEHQYESIINKLPHDCSEIETNANGTRLYLIAPIGQHRPLMAHCAGDGWTTVQRRYDGSADFNRSWEDYATGFGSPSGEYWIGNEQLHALTQNNCTALRIQMQDIYDNSWVAEYARFYISPRSDGYRLHIAGYSGNASDALDYQQGMQFSAIDVDRDISQTHCAANYEGGWWFSHCQHANLNGRYNLGLTWFDGSRNEWIAVKSSQMLIKRLPAAACEEAVAAIVASESETAMVAAASAAATQTQAATATRTANVNVATQMQAPSSVVVLVDGSSSSTSSSSSSASSSSSSNDETLARVRTTTTISSVV